MEDVEKTGEQLARIMKSVRDGMAQLAEALPEMGRHVQALLDAVQNMDTPDSRHVLAAHPDSGWILLHPLACRKNLVDCDFHYAMSWNGLPRGMSTRVQYFARIEGKDTHSKVVVDGPVGEQS